MNELTRILESSLSEIKNERFYESERGYQGELNGLISSKLKGLMETQLISENEYQKKQSEHGLRIRPDIIIHEPFNEEIHTSRKEGNYLVLELKLRGSINKVLEDFDSIDSMIGNLSYHNGAFINIGSDNTFSDHYYGPYRDRIDFYAVNLNEGIVEIAKA